MGLREYIDHWIDLLDIGRTFDSMVELLLLDQVTSSTKKDLRQHITTSGVTRLNETIVVAECFRKAHEIPRTHAKDLDLASGKESAALRD